ncbi:unnamed protein product [Cuscuta campestris]|uniref:GAG-pre-integrase domain-containing protein n=1 Tax=Cuscuta campestris TaxID=132261 RepID=A0A484L2M0_9ASTE|nr:unnamed protein product [Cuscuta campestris]
MALPRLSTSIMLFSPILDEALDEAVAVGRHKAEEDRTAAVTLAGLAGSRCTVTMRAAEVADEGRTSHVNYVGIPQSELPICLILRRQVLGRSIAGAGKKYKDFTIRDYLTNQVLFKGPCEHGLYSMSASHSSLVVNSIKVTPYQCHCRLGHPSAQVTKSLLS